MNKTEETEIRLDPRAVLLSQVAQELLNSVMEKARKHNMTMAEAMYVMSSVLQKTSQRCVATEAAIIEQQEKEAAKKAEKSKKEEN